MKQLLTVDELSKMLQVPKSWIYERTRTGEIPTIPNMGKYKRFDPDAIARLFSQQRSSLAIEYERKGRRS